jgi:hypothetical protein
MTDSHPRSPDPHLQKQNNVFIRLAHHYGQYQTIRQWSCIDNKGSPIPWYTYPAIEYLAHLDISAMKVLEYGSGNSTLWWAERCAQLVSIESNVDWYNKIANSIRIFGNTTYLLKTEQDSYVHQDYLAIADIVIIDGVYRSKCAEALIESVAKSSGNMAMLIFDNSDWYPKTIRRLAQSLAWIQSDFHGFGPINDYTWTTSLFINPHTYRSIKYAKSLMSVCGLAENAINNADDN